MTYLLAPRRCAKSRPDFLVRLGNGEVKPGLSEGPRQVRYLAECLVAVNEYGGFGRRATGVSLSPSDLAVTRRSTALWARESACECQRLFAVGVG